MSNEYRNSQLARLSAALVDADQSTRLKAALAAGTDPDATILDALIALGEATVEPMLREATTNDDPRVRAHAAATERMPQDPDAGFDLAVHRAKRVFALGLE